MAMSVLSGPASGIELAARTRGDGPRGACAFRIGNRPARLELAMAPQLREGDVVTIAGYERAHGFVGYALANHTTGAICADVSWPYALAGGALVLIGVPLSMVVLGIPLFAAGVWLLHVAHRNAEACRLLATGRRAL
ncbi:MAG: hypothetical protein K8S98_02300 [Planctomycetes bacterium]|nr:hypothetical protein [Planctomycetota bacterium]